MSGEASPGRIRPGELRQKGFADSVRSPLSGASPRSTLSSSNLGRSFAGSPKRGMSFNAQSPKNSLARKTVRTAMVGGELMKITKDDVEAVFKFFDEEGKGVLKAKDLKAKLEVFFPHFTTKEYKLLISEPNFTVETLWALIAENMGYLSDCDPAQEAFNAFDPQRTGFLDPPTLRSIMRQMGYGDMSDEDMNILIKTSDTDKDGAIDIADFRGMLGFYPGFGADNASDNKASSDYDTLTDDDD